MAPDKRHEGTVGPPIGALQKLQFVDLLQKDGYEVMIFRVGTVRTVYAVKDEATPSIELGKITKGGRPPDWESMYKRFANTIAVAPLGKIKDPRTKDQLNYNLADKGYRVWVVKEAGNRCYWAASLTSKHRVPLADIPKGASTDWATLWKAFQNKKQY